MNLNWLWTIDYGLFWLYIYIYGRYSLYDTNINVLTNLTISLFLAASASTVRRARNLIGTSVRNGLRLFLLFGKKHCFIQKLSFLVNNLFGKKFSNFKTNSLNDAAICKTPMLKKYLNSWKKHLLVWQFRENQSFIIFALFSCFSVFSTN